MRGAFAGLSMNHGDAHLARAVLEGCAYALRDIVDRLDALGLADDEVRVVGGGARSPLWLQIKADVLNRPVRPVLAEEPTALGAAMLAGVAGGTFADFDDAVARAVAIAPEPIVPDAARVARYAEGYAAYRRLFDGIEGALGVTTGAGPATAGSTSPRCARGSPRRRTPTACGRSAWAGSSPARTRSRCCRRRSPSCSATPAAPVALLADATPMRRGGEDLKADGAAALGGDRRGAPGARRARRRPARTPTRRRSRRRGAAAEGASAIVTVGSGTVADIGKAVAARARRPAARDRADRGQRQRLRRRPVGAAAKRGQADDALALARRAGARRRRARRGAAGDEPGRPRRPRVDVHRDGRLAPGPRGRDGRQLLRHRGRARAATAARSCSSWRRRSPATRPPRSCGWPRSSPSAASRWGSPAAPRPRRGWSTRSATCSRWPPSGGAGTPPCTAPRSA